MAILPLKSTRALQSSAELGRNYRGTIKTSFSLSTRQLITQSRVRAPLLRLPDDILDDIVSELDLHKDLINFAAASHACANIVIP